MWFRPFERSSWLKDGMGVALVLGTLALHAFEASSRGVAEECAPCEEVVAPVETKPEPEGARAVTGRPSAAPPTAVGLALC